MQLRPYQEGAVRAVMRKLWRRPLLVAPTGSGKTFMGVDLVHRLNARTLWVAHRRELIRQAAASIRATGEEPGLILAGEQANLYARVQVASIQTLGRRRDEMPACDLVVIDEAHHATAGQYTALFELGVPVVGMTATPFRLDGSSLGDLFGELVVAAQVAELVEAGVLHQPTVYASAEPNLRGCRLLGGDYSAAEVATRMNRPDLVGDIVQTWKMRAPGSRTVCFAIDVGHSRGIVAAFNAAGVPAEHLDGSMTPEVRDAVLERLRRAQTMVVSNCMVLTEGWDLPQLRCAILARPTASLCLHLQMVGRIMRACPGKQGVLVLDHAGNHHRHGSVTRRLAFSLEGPTKAPPGEALGLSRCDVCGLMFASNLAACPGCGHQGDPVARKIRHAAGELGIFDDTAWAYRAAYWRALEAHRLEVGAPPGSSLRRFTDRFGVQPLVIDGELINPDDDSQANKRRVYEHFVRIAHQRGFSEGWASHRFRAVFGVWPRGVVSDVRAALADETLQRKVAGSGAAHA